MRSVTNVFGSSEENSALFQLSRFEHIFVFFVSRSRFRRSSFCVLVFCVFHSRSFVEVSSCHWRPMTVRQDRRWQTQKKKGWMAGQVRMEELLAKAVTIGCRRRTCGQDRSVAGVRQTFRQWCKAHTCRLYQPRGRWSESSSSGEGEGKVLA